MIGGSESETSHFNPRKLYIAWRNRSQGGIVEAASRRFRAGSETIVSLRERGETPRLLGCERLLAWRTRSGTSYRVLSAKSKWFGPAELTTASSWLC
jgi:hypothetical protein